MAGRTREPEAEVRDRRTSVRWTESEFKQLQAAQVKHGFKHLVDVPRVMALRQFKLEELIGDEAENLEKVRKLLGLESTEEALWTLARRRLEQISSMLENDVAE